MCIEVDINGNRFKSEMIALQLCTFRMVEKPAWVEYMYKSLLKTQLVIAFHFGLQVERFSHLFPQVL